MLQKILLLCGILSPLLYAFADTLSGILSEGYSFRDQTISELGAIGAPSRPIFSALLILVYLLLIAFGVGVWQSAYGRRNIQITSGLLIGFSILALTVGQLASMHPRGIEQGMVGALHLIEGGVAMLIILAAMIFAATSLGRAFRLYTIITIGLMFGFGIWSGLEIPRVEAGLATPWVGVKERIFWYSYQLWFVSLAIKLLRQKFSESKPAGHNVNN